MGIAWCTVGAALHTFSCCKTKKKKKDCRVEKVISCSMFRIKIQFYFYYLLLSVVRFPFTAAASPFNAGTKLELQESMHLSFTAMVRSAERSRSPKTSILPINHASLRIPASLHESRTCRAQCGISLWGTGGSTIHRLSSLRLWRLIIKMVAVETQPNSFLPFTHT